MNGEMDVLDPTGHTKTTWDSENESEIEAARRLFDALTAKGFKAFRVKKDGSEDMPMKRFDPEAERMILVPPVQGG